MAGETIPAVGYVSNASRTTAEMKDALEDMNAVARRSPGMASYEVATISAGTLAPTAGYVYVAGEGAVPDDLDTITSAPYATGARLFIRANVDLITVKHGTTGAGHIKTIDSADFALGGSRVLELMLHASGHWFEIGRNFQAMKAEERTWLGLGTVAVLDDGNVSAADLNGFDDTDFYKVGNQVGDADTVDGLEASQFIRNDLVSLQSMVHNLKVGEGRFIADNGSGATSGIEFTISDTLRGQLYFDTAGTPDVIRLDLFENDGTTLSRALRLGEGDKLEFWNGTAWLDMEDTLGGAQRTDFVEHAGITTHVHATGFRAVGYTFEVPSGRCFTPRVVSGTMVNTTWGNWVSSDTAKTVFRLGAINTTGPWTCDCTVHVDYV